MRTKINQINKKVAASLKDKNLSLAAAESCTGGLFSDYITNIPGASEYFKGGIVSYSNESKIKILKVSEELVKKYGAVNAEVSLEMAKGARKVFSSSLAISVTGIAGPRGATETKPVGLVYISISGEGHKKTTKKFVFKGGRSSVKLQAVHEMLCMLYEYL